MGAVLHQLAQIHAAFWRSLRFADDLAWVATPRQGRWEALFLPDAHIAYTSAGGIAGTPAIPLWAGLGEHQPTWFEQRWSDNPVAGPGPGPQRWAHG